MEWEQQGGVDEEESEGEGDREGEKTSLERQSKKRKPGK